MDEKTPHLHLVFVPLTEDNRLCAKEIIGNRANLTKWQDDFHAYMAVSYTHLAFVIINDHEQSSTVVKRNYNVEVKNTYTYSQAESQLKNRCV